MMQRVIQWILRPKPLFYAVSYTEPDGTLEVDIKDCSTCANSWADWCKRDGCTEVEVSPLYTEQEIYLARLRRSDFQGSLAGSA